MLQQSHVNGIEGFYVPERIAVRGDKLQIPLVLFSRNVAQVRNGYFAVGEH